MAGALSIEAATRWGQAALSNIGVEDPRAEARLLLSRATGLSREGLFIAPERPLDADESKVFEDLVGRRAAREPMARILGRREFWSLTFEVTADTLDPRPDSEAVVEAALDLMASADHPHRVLDLGTGTGCLLLSLLSEWPNAEGIGVDINPRAAAVAARNARAHGLDERASFMAADWTAAIEGLFDLVVSNPPYIARGEIDHLAPEVAVHEPRRALDGGEDGLAAYRGLIPRLGRLMKPGGTVVLEIGMGQKTAVADLMRRANFTVCGQRRDLAGIVRCVAARAG
jgi:release factor glutamine methyltransferase